MKRTYISDLKKSGKVGLTGWVFEYRVLAKMAFILLRDSTGVVQCITKEPKIIKKISGLTLESVVGVEGKIKKAKVKARYAKHDIEIEINKLEIMNKASKLPIHVNEKTVKSSLPSRLDFRSLDIRKPEIKAVFKIQSTIINAFREYFYRLNFIEMQPPGIIATSTEGGTDLFEVNYFDKKAYLAQSPQLYKQLAAISWEKVFSTSPVWRAEKHDTSKHINEIRQMDIECAFKNDLEIMKYMEDVVKFIVKKVIKECSSELRLLKIDLKVPKTKYLTYKEAIDLLAGKGLKIEQGDDFEPEAERKLCELFPNTIIFTYEWPIELKPFYIWPKDEVYGVSGGFDAVYGNIEICSGGQRVHIPDMLTKQIENKGLDSSHFKWYIDAFRHGAPVHAGWSIGLERLTQAMLGLDNIREATLFPRDRKRLTP